MMREFSVATPAKEGIVLADDGETAIDLTPEDADDLNRGHSITTLTPSGEEVAVFPSEKS